MVTTRAMRARAWDDGTSPSLAEEKKDDYDDVDFNFVSSSSQQASNKEQRPQSVVVDECTIESDAAAISSKTKARNEKKNKGSGNSPLLLLTCASGITFCYLWYGTVQERVFHMDNHEKKINTNTDNGDDDDDGTSEDGAKEDTDESITLFLLATGTFSALLLAWIWTIIGPIILKSSSATSTSTTSEDEHNKKAANGGGKLNHPLILLTSLTYLIAMAASNESLHYVSYPTCVLAKSAKLVPTMIVGWLVDCFRCWKQGGGSSKRKGTGGSINRMEWIGAVLITLGIISFQYIQLHKQQQSGSGGHHGGGNEEKADSPYGLALLALSLTMDGLLGACQSVLKQEKNIPSDESITKKDYTSYRPPTAMETMLYINLYATMVLLLASHYVGQLERGLSILRSNDTTKSFLLLQLNLSASLGQIFIFLTIHHFSPLTCTTITTTRKFFTILLSVYNFGHVLNVWQWCSVGCVFGGLYLQIVAKLYFVADDDDDEVVEVGKKKKMD